MIFWTTDDKLTYVQSYDTANKIRFEENYDGEGRVILYRNLTTGDELRYEYDDPNKKVTITSSGNYFRQVYEFDESHPGISVSHGLLKKSVTGSSGNGPGPAAYLHYHNRSGYRP